MTAPTLVPISPVILVVSMLSNAPAAVNRAKPEVDPKSGACAKFTFGLIIKTDINMSSNLLFIFSEKIFTLQSCAHLYFQVLHNSFIKLHDSHMF